MERAAKRQRLSAPEWQEVSSLDNEFAEDQRNSIKRNSVSLGEVAAPSNPTSTLDLQDLERHRLELRHEPFKPGMAMKLLPRAPEITVTANVVHIDVLDDLDQTSFTQVTAQASDILVPISRVGIVTVPGVSDLTNSLGSIISNATPGVSSSGSLGASTTGTLSSSIPGNGTSSAERTVTVTATSTLRVSVKNSTSTTLSPSRSRTVLTTEGSTITVDDSSSTHSPTGFRFGDVISSAVTSHSTNTYYGGPISTATTTSGSEAVPSSTGSGSGVVLTPQQQQVVGGVVGGVAGVALVLLGILYLLKWYRHQLKSQGRLPEQRSRHKQLPSVDGHDLIPSAAMKRQSQSSLIPITAFKQSLQKIRPRSTNTLASDYTQQSSIPTTGSERGFHRVSGRKIPSVLLNGGDGYGEKRPVSPLSEYSSFAPSREVSQISSLRESSNVTNPFVAPARTRTSSIYSTPSRVHVSPFLDPPNEDEDEDDSSFQMMEISPNHRVRTSKSQLSIQTAGLSALNPNRQSDGNVLIRPSPARTPTTTSPTTSSLKLPMHTPPLMSGDIPEMPVIHPLRYGMGVRTFSEDGLSTQRSMGPRSISAYSIRSTSSVGGKFKEDV